MGTDLRDLVTGAAPVPSRPLDMSAVAAGGRRLGYARVALLACVFIGATAAVTFAAVSDGLFKAAEPARPLPAAPGEDRSQGTLVFAGETENREGALYTVDPDHGMVTELIARSEWHQVENPSWSGSARRIVFNAFLPGDERSSASLNSELFIVDADGGDLEQVTDDEEPLTGPAWDPYARFIAYGRADNAAAWELWGVRDDGFDPHLISGRSTGGDYAWSPDGRHLAFSEFLYRDDGRELVAQAIFAMNVNNGTVERLTHGEGRAAHPVWSPDGSQIAYLCDDGTGFDICMMEADGSASYELYETIPGDDPVDPVAGLAWSPDGTRLAFGTRGDDGSQLMTVDPMGRYDRPIGPPQRYIHGIDWR